MTEKHPCDWCHALVNVEDDYDPKVEKVVCDWKCWWLEKLFCQHYSDYNIYLRREYEDDET